MTGSTQILLAAGGYVVPNLPLPALIDAVVGGTCTCSIRFYTQGEVDGRRNGNVLHWLLNWFKPTTVGIGSNYWLRVNVTSGAFTSSSGTGVWLPMSAVNTYTIAKSTIGAQSCNFNFSIAQDAAGTKIVGTGTGYIEASRE